MDKPPFYRSSVARNESDDSLGSITLSFRQFQSQGDPVAAKAIWKRFFPRLIGLAKRVLDGQSLPAEAEDAVQEAFMQFFESVQNGKYAHPVNRDDLWRILSMITVQRVRKQVSRERAQKRGGGHVRLASQIQGTGSGSLKMDEAISVLPTAEWDLAIAEIFELLDTELQRVAMMRLAGYTNMQIKDELRCSLRSVERRVQIIRVTWQEI